VSDEVKLPVVSFEARNPVLLMNVLKDVNCFVDEVTISIGYDGLRIRQMNAARIALVDCFITKENFDTWFVEREGKFAIIIPDVLKSVFIGIKKDDTLEMKMTGDGGEKLEFIVKNNIGVKKRRVTFLEGMEDEVPVPKYSPDACVKIMVKPFIKDLKDLEKAEVPSIRLVADMDRSVKVEGSSSTALFENIYEIKKSDVILNAEVNRESKARYALDYLLKFAFPKELTAICDYVELAWADNMPLKVTALGCPIELKHYIAPKIDVD